MTSALSCSDLAAGYQKKPVVRDFALEIASGEVVAMLGPNGAGKTTILLTLAGLVPRLSGTVDICGVPMAKGSATEANRSGLVLVPDDRSLFRGLTVKENLVLGRNRGGPTIDDILGFFPILAKRLNVPAGMTSGGEQQMVAIGRAMMQQPKLLLIDELSMGLAPVIVQELLPIVRDVATQTGAGVLLVEQHVHVALGVSDRAIVVVHGSTVLAGPADELAADTGRLEAAYLGD